MPTGQYKRKLRGERVTLVCEICESEIVLLASVLRQRKTVRFCSVKCAGISFRKPDRYTLVTCSTCSKKFLKRIDHLTVNNYCSRKCLGDSRRKEYVKWNDKEYIKGYMAEYVQANKARLSQQRYAYAVAHPEQRKISKRKWRQNNPDAIVIASQRRRSKKAALPHTLTREEWKYALDYFEHSCVACGRTFTKSLRASQDHWVAQDKGGGYVASNIVPLCCGATGCNNSKNSRSAEKWLKRRFGDVQAAIVMKRVESYFDSLI